MDDPVAPNTYLLEIIYNPLDANGNFTIPVAIGDFILVRKSCTLFDRLIAFGQGFRFKGSDRKYSAYIHTAIVTHSSGDLIESDNKGVRQTKITDYQGIDVTLVKLNLSEEDKGEIWKYTNSCLREGYGWATDFSIGLSLMTGLKFSFGFEGEQICSGLVAKALEHGGREMPRDASHMCPADLAKMFMG